VILSHAANFIAASRNRDTEFSFCRDFVMRVGAMLEFFRIDGSVAMTRLRSGSLCKPSRTVPGVRPARSYRSLLDSGQQ
jgi:hypothetical protein